MNDSKRSRRSTTLRLNADTSRHEKEIEGPESEDGEGRAISATTFATSSGAASFYNKPRISSSTTGG